MLDDEDPRNNELRRRARRLLEAIQTPAAPRVAPAALDWLAQQDGLGFTRLRAAQAVWEEQPELRLGERLLGTLRGLDGGANCWHCWLISYAAAREELHLNLGLPTPTPARQLTPLLPLVRFEAADAEQIQRAARHRHQRFISGVLANRSTDERYVPQLEQLLEIRADFDWSCWVFLAPAPYHYWHTAQAQLLEHQELFSQELERSVTVGRESGRRSGGVIARALAVVERQLERLAEGLAHGFWLSSIILTAEDERVALLATQLTTTFAAPEAVQPLRTFQPDPGGSGGDPRQLIGAEHTTRELAALVTIPRTERPGFRVAPYAPFDLDTGAQPQLPITLGQVVLGERDTRIPYMIASEALTRHGLVVGITGSGKSNTCKLLAGKLGELGVPILVIEPAKVEYRSLGLRTYTPGDERGAPIRLNPFELPAVTVAGSLRFVPVQTHIDTLKAVFNASFVLFAPMPYVLERCLHEIYLDRGWDLASGLNSRGAHLERLFPTLSDLYAKIDEVVGRLGYEQRLEMDIRAGLLARIESLRIGGRGLLLDTSRSSPTIDGLLGESTVLELEAIGSDEEKSFVMGLLLALVYEYRALQAAVQREQEGVASQNPALRHLVLIEEAHRLLASDRRQGGSGDRADVGGQTLEIFANMLAEMRAYGQGFLIVDQVPSRLDQSVIKNTELKIVHKLVAPDDRELLARAANLSERQSSYVATLPQGYAVVHGGADDRPFLVHMQPYVGVARGLSPPREVPPPLVSCSAHCLAWQTKRRCPTQLRDIGRRIAGRVDARHMLGVLIAATEGKPYVLHRAITRTIRASAQQDAPNDAEVVSTCATLHSVEAALAQFERHYPRWPIERSVELVALGMERLLPGALQQLQPLLVQGLAASGPYQLCAEQCRQPCRYRLLAVRLVAPVRIALRTISGEAPEALIARLAARYSDRLWGAAPPPEAQQGFQTCLLIHMAMEADAAHAGELMPAARDRLRAELDRDAQATRFGANAQPHEEELP